MPEYSFQLVTARQPELCFMAYEQLKADDSLKFFEYGDDLEMTAERFYIRHINTRSHFLAGFIDGGYAGFLTLRPWDINSQCAYVGVSAFRPWYDTAIPFSRAAFAYCYANLNVSSMIAHVVRTNHHILRLCRACGFVRLGTAPGMYYDRKHDRFESGHILLSTPSLLGSALEV